MNVTIRARHMSAVVLILSCATVLLLLPVECWCLCGSGESPPFFLDTLTEGPVVRGNVVDKFNGRPVREATVSVHHVDSDSLAALPDSTDSDGFFSITVPDGSYLLKVTHPGYFPSDPVEFDVGGVYGDFVTTVRCSTRTVLLVSGWLGTDEAWEAAGWGESHPGLDSCSVWTPAMPGNLGILGTQSLAAQVAYLEDYIGDLDVASVYLVGHSFGGLVCRKYAEKSDPRGVVRLFTLATPNHGSPLAGAPGAALTLAKGILGTGVPWEWLVMPLDQLWEELTSTFGAVVDLIPNSPALVGLNQSCSNPVFCYDWFGYLLPWPAQESLTSQETEYFAVTASRPGLNPIYSIPAVLLRGMGAGFSDGVVPVFSAPLWSEDDRVRNYWDRTIDGGSHHRDADFWTDGIVQSNAIRDSVIEWMFRPARTPSHWDPPIHPFIPPWPVPDGRQEAVMVGLPMIDGVVGEGETVVQTLAVEPTDSLNIALSWYEGNMFLELDDALGVRVDTALAYIDRESGAVIYGIADPEPGDWTLRVVSQPSVPQQRFTVSASVASETVVRLESSPSFARPGDDVIVRATLATGASPELGATVVATVAGPLGAPTQMQLYDDGTHGDELPDDGIYTNGFTAAEAGLYSLHVEASTAPSQTSGRSSVHRESYALVNSADLCDVGIIPASLQVLNAVTYVDVPCQVACELTNLGVVTCDTVVVRFSAGTPFNSFCESTVALEPGETTQLICDFMPTSPDTQSLFVTTYLRGNQQDENSDNDSEWIEFTPELGVANLTITDVVVSNDLPEPGEAVTVEVTVVNDGTAKTAGTFVDIYYDLDTPPVQLERGDQQMYILPLMPGEKDTLTCSPFSYPEVALYHLYAQVDPEDRCVEQNEGDNVFGPVSVNVPVGIQEHGSLVAIAESSTAITLTWSLDSLAPCSALNVYRSAGDGGAFFRVNEEPLGCDAVGEFHDSTVWPGTDYQYELRAQDSHGEERPLSPPVSVRTPGDLSFALRDVRPNPFSQDTVVSYDVGSACGNVKLDVFDVSGRLVRTLVNAPSDRGRFSVAWDGADGSGRAVAGGVYFIRMSAGNWQTTGKAVLIR